MKKNFTNSEKRNGELAVRAMSDKARRFYDGSDPLALYKCIENVLDENGDFVCDDDGNELEVKRYYVRGFIDLNGLTFEEVEAEFESMQDENDAMENCEF